MSGTGSADETKRGQTSECFENEAEESDDLFGDKDKDSQDEADADDDGKDLEDFIAKDGEEAAKEKAPEAEEGSDASSDGSGLELEADDLAVLEDSGLNTSQLRAAKRPHEDIGGKQVAGDNEEQTAKRAREEAIERERQEARAIFGDSDGEDDATQGAALVQPSAGFNDDLWDDMSDVDNVIVDDVGQKQRDYAEEAAAHNITEKQLLEIIDIFGDTSVLQPIGEMMFTEELEPEEAIAAPSPRPSLDASDVLSASHHGDNFSAVPGSSNDPASSHPTPIAALGTPIAALGTPQQGTPIAAMGTPQQGTPIAGPASQTPLDPSSVLASGSPAPQQAPGSSAGMDMFDFFDESGSQHPPSSRQHPPSTSQQAPSTRDKAPETPSQPVPATPSHLRLSSAGLQMAQLPHLIDTTNAPERWVRTYLVEPSLLDVHGRRIWTEEENTCEANYIYQEHFWEQHFDDAETKVFLKELLHMLHEEKLDPNYILSQNYWEFQAKVWPDDLKKVFALDVSWQAIWAKYQRIAAWEVKLREKQVQIPSHISQRLQSKLFENTGANQEIEDLYYWFKVVHGRDIAALPPDIGEPLLTSTRSRENDLLNAVSDHKLDQHLGVVPGRKGKKEKYLHGFGITPEQLGENLEVKERTHQVADNEDDNPVNACAQMVKPNSPLISGKVVMEAVVVYLSRLIASEPRIRRYVRKQFRNYCCISTTPTEKGLLPAREASHNFKEEYRAFHITNRPISKFDKDDTLFLDILNLQRKGLIQFDFSLCMPRKAKDIDSSYNIVAMGYTERTIGKLKVKLQDHNKAYIETGTVPEGEHDLRVYREMEALSDKLKATARAHEVMSRLKTVGVNQTEELYKCAKMQMNKPMHNNSFLAGDPIQEKLEMNYCYVEQTGADEYQIVQSNWNNLRQAIIKRALLQELYPQLWAEMQSYLAKQAEDVVCKKVSEALKKKIDMQPYKITAHTLADQKHQKKMSTHYKDDLSKNGDDSDSDNDAPWQREKRSRMDGYGSVLSIVPDIYGDQCVAALVNQFGDPVDVRILIKSFFIEPNSRELENPPPVGSWKAVKLAKEKEHRIQFLNMIKLHQPALILLPVSDLETQHMKAQIDKYLWDLMSELKVLPKVIFGDSSVARAVAYSTRLQEQGVYRDCELPHQRIAISAARFVQDPVSECCQLWHEDASQNGLLKLQLHRLQHTVQTNNMMRQLSETLMEVVGKAGVNVNRMRRSGHIASILPFVSGLGRHSAPTFQKCLTDVIKNREQLTTRIFKHFGKEKTSLVDNVMPFVRICPLPGDESWDVDEMPGLDRTRLGETLRPWLQMLCREGLQEVGDAEVAPDESDSDDDSLFEGSKEKSERKKTKSEQLASQKDYIKIAMARIQREKSVNDGQSDFENRLYQMPIDSFREKVKASKPLPEDAQLPTLLTSVLIPELVYPGRDQRQEFAELDAWSVMYSMIKQSPSEFKEGCLIHAIVDKDREHESKTQNMEKLNMSVSVTIVPYLLRGTFDKQHQMDSGKGGYIQGCDMVFKKNCGVLARVTGIIAKPDQKPRIRLSVDPESERWKEKFTIKGDDLYYFVPAEAENWQTAPLGLISDEKDNKKQEHKEFVQRVRNIRHPNYITRDHVGALNVIDNQPLGNVVFRSSKSHDTLLAYLKVMQTKDDGTEEDQIVVGKEKCYRLFEIKEFRDDMTLDKSQLELAADLRIDGCSYRNLDEIIAVHMDPIMENLRLLKEHPKFGIRSGIAPNRKVVYDAVEAFSQEDTRTLQYALCLDDLEPGHGVLTWALGGRKPKEEHIEVTPSGYSLWGQPFETIRDLVMWFKREGWRQAAKLRSEVKEKLETKKERAKRDRGEDVLEEDRAKAKARGIRPAGSVKAAFGGMQTPGGSVPGTPSKGFATPGGSGQVPATPQSGFATPGAASGFATPRQPGTPRQQGFATPRQPGTPRQQGFATPRQPGTPTAGGRIPSTPAGLLQQNRMQMASASMLPAAQNRMPMTPANLMAPAPQHGMQLTQANMMPAAQNRMPMTPVGLMAPVAQNRMPMTPVGLVAPAAQNQMTPASTLPSAQNRMPMTPVGLMAPQPTGQR